METKNLDPSSVPTLQKAVESLVPYIELSLEAAILYVFEETGKILDWTDVNRLVPIDEDDMGLSFRLKDEFWADLRLNNFGKWNGNVVDVFEII